MDVIEIVALVPLVFILLLIAMWLFTNLLHGYNEARFGSEREE